MSEWISVKDAYPEDYESVLFTSGRGMRRPLVAMAAASNARDILWMVAIRTECPLSTSCHHHNQAA